MATAWETLERVETEAGTLELRRRGEQDFLITVAGRVLMNSHANRSELALADLACTILAPLSRPRVLLGGLGMGCTLGAALAGLPAGAEIEVVELNPHIAAWCRGPLAEINARALDDPRVRLRVDDVAAVIRKAARSPDDERYDAILLDLYEGPHPGSHARDDPFYGSRALARSRGALGKGGILAVWGETSDRHFIQRMQAAGFETEVHRPGKGGLRHAVHLGRRNGQKPRA